MAPLRWASPGHRATSFSLSGDCRQGGRNKPGAPQPRSHPRGVRVQQVRPCHQQRASKCPPSSPSPVHTPPRRCGTSCHGGGLLAALSPSAAAGLPGPHGQGLCSPFPVHSPAQGSHGTSFHRGEQGGTEAVAPQLPNTRYVFRNWDHFSSAPRGIHIILENA